MAADAATPSSDTFVFHAKFGANTVSGFDPLHDFLQFDKGMFGAGTPLADTALAVLNASHDDGHGNVIIDGFAGNVRLLNTSVAQLAAHQDLFTFV